MAYAGKLTYKTELDTSGVEKAGSTVKSIIAGLGITKMISMAMSTISDSIDGAISRLDTLNNFPKVMSNLGISAEDSSKSIKKMSDKLSGLPTTLDQGANAVQRFTSANSDVEKSTDIFLALNNAILAGGASTEIQASALEQLSQAYAKGKPDMMEWRTAMTAMPAQLKQVAKAMGYVSADKLGESLRNGTVSMDEFMDTIVELNEKGIDGFQNFEEQARNSTGGIKTSITVAKTQIVKGVTDIINALNKNFEKTKFGSLAGFISQIGEKVKKALNSIAKVISGEMSFKEFGDAGFKAMTNFMDGIAAKLPDILNTMGNIISQLISSLNENISDIYQSGVDLITTFVNGVSEQLPELIPQVVQTIINLFMEIQNQENLDKISQAGVNLVISLIKGIINSIPLLIINSNFTLTAFLNALSGGKLLLIKIGFSLVKALIKGIINSIPEMISTGKELINGIWKGIKNKGEELKKKISGLAKDIVKNFKNALQIGSPSKTMSKEVGQWIPKGIAVGIDANTDSVTKAMNDMYDEINKEIKMENSKLNFNVLSGDVYNKSFYQTPVEIDINANVEMDSQKVGRLVTPSVTKTIKTGGGI